MDVAHSCRCCLRRALDKDLTTPYTHLGTTEIYSDMLKECFEIHLSLGGDSECGICDVCVGRLRDASDFKLQVQRSQAELQARLRGALQVKEEAPAVKSEAADDGDTGNESVFDVFYEERIEKSELVHGDDTGEDMLCADPLILCVKSEVSGGGVASDEVLSAPPVGAGAEPARPVSARARDQLALTRSVRLERLRGDEAPRASQTWLATSRRGPRRASRMKDLPDDTAGARAGGQAYTCDTCGEQFADKSRLIKHTQAHSTQADKLRVTYSCKTYTKHVNAHMNNGTYTCDTFGAKFRTKSILIDHVGTHKGGKRYPCEICNKTFVNKSVMKQHKMIHSGKKPFTCDECNKQFQYKGNLIAHVRIHTGVKPYSCKVCDKQYTQKQNLNKHKRIHTGETPYSCKECNKQFRLKQSLDKHKKIHTGEKPYGCKECSKKFTQKQQLDSHKRIHTGERPYNCKECKKQFALKQHLDRHKRIHTGEKPYGCKECGKHFTREDHLDDHKRIHNGEKPYGCEECDKKFTQKQSLDRHKKSHTGEKPYGCKECDKLFTRKHHLDRHIKNSHRREAI